MCADGRTRSSSAGTDFCSQVLRARTRPRPRADRPCLNLSRTRTSTALERPKCFSGPVRWLFWRGWDLRGCALLRWSSRAEWKDGWHRLDTPRSAGQLSPYRDTAEELWPDGEDRKIFVCLCSWEKYMNKFDMVFLYITVRPWKLKITLHCLHIYIYF